MQSLGDCHQICSILWRAGFFCETFTVLDVLRRFCAFQLLNVAVNGNHLQVSACVSVGNAALE